jgi:hypothetical protein
VVERVPFSKLNAMMPNVVELNKNIIQCLVQGFLHSDEHLFDPMDLYILIQKEMESNMLLQIRLSSPVESEIFKLFLSCSDVGARQRFVGFD